MENTTLRRHAALMDRMAGAMGLDLEEEVLRGRLSLDAMGDAVFACTGCTAPGTCERMLLEDALARAEGAQPGEGAAPGLPPAFCRNGDLLRGLLPGKR